VQIIVLGRGYLGAPGYRQAAYGCEHEHDRRHTREQKAQLASWRSVV
jgi:hypothetical protein